MSVSAHSVGIAVSVHFLVLLTQLQKPQSGAQKRYTLALRCRMCDHSLADLPKLACADPAIRASLFGDDSDEDFLLEK